MNSNNGNAGVGSVGGSMWAEIGGGEQVCMPVTNIQRSVNTDDSTLFRRSIVVSSSTTASLMPETVVVIPVGMEKLHRAVSEVGRFGLRVSRATWCVLVSSSVFLSCIIMTYYSLSL